MVGPSRTSLISSFTLSVSLSLSACQKRANTAALVVWLPYGSGLRAVCGQGPHSSGSHKGIFAWDFILDEGRPVVAAAGGRVFWVIDDRKETGFNSFNDSNHIFVDQGGGIFATYTHHKTETARVGPGQLIAAGTHLAGVGKMGTIVPHIHFDLRGPSWHQTHDIRFRAAADYPVEIKQGDTSLSATLQDTNLIPDKFQDSILQGEEFLPNGIRLDRGHRAFWLQSEKPTIFEGEVDRRAKIVGFYLWKNGKTTEYAVTTVPDHQGRFRLTVLIPRGSKGASWYRISIQDNAGHFPDPATLPAMVE